MYNVPRETESKRVMCASRAVCVFVCRDDAALMVERVEHFPRLTAANSLVFSARKRYRSRQRKVTPELRSRKALYRLVRVPTSGTRLNRPISVEPCAVKSRGIQVYRQLPL